jgi:hypothetical protein
MRLLQSKLVLSIGLLTVALILTSALAQAGVAPP